MTEKKELTENEKEAAKTFTNARGYQIVAAVLDRLEGNGQKITHYQMIANEVFALELSIKAVHQLRGVKVGGHDINALFAQLAQQDRDAITKHYDVLIKKHPSHQWAVDRSIPLDIDSVLLRNRNTFIVARYWHEGKNPLSDDQGNISNAGTGSLSEAIRLTILDEYPLWVDDNLAKAIKPGGENSKHTT